MAVNKSSKTNSAKRFLKEDREIISDTWKLKTTKFIRRMDRSPADRPMWEDRDHNHIFRTYDSNGRKLDKSSSIGGHYHEITTYEKDGELYAECGPAIYNKASRDTTKNSLAPVDNHTHDLEFQGSDLIKMRKHNPKAQQFVQQYSNHLREQQLQDATSN